MADIVIPERTENIYNVLPAVSLNNLYSGITIPQNPGLAPNNRSGAHQDSYCSESVSLTGPTGRRLKAIVQRNPYGLGAIMAVNDSGQLITVAGDVITGNFTLVTFDEDCNLTSATVIGRTPIFDPDSGEVNFAGGYFFLNKDYNAVVSIDSRLKCYPTTNVPKQSQLYELSPIWISEDLVEAVTGNAEGNMLYSALPFWDASKPDWYWCLFAGDYDSTNKVLNSPVYIALVEITPPGAGASSGRRGRCARAGHADTTGDPVAATTVIASMQCPTSWNNNTVTVSEQGAFFVTNDVNPSTGVCDTGYLWAVGYANGSINLRWKYSYENSGFLKVGQTNIGSGTTPTITVTADGMTLVGITDNAYPRMHTVVINDANGSLYSKVPVLPKMRGCDEASLIGVQDCFFVESNFGHTVSLFQSQLVSNEPGMAMIQVPAAAPASSSDNSTIVWEDNRTTFFGMSMLARESGVIFSYNGEWYDTESASKGGNFFVSAADSWDGRIIWRIPVGRGRPYTHEYGGVYFNRTGDKIYIGTNRYLVSIQSMPEIDISPDD